MTRITKFVDAFWGTDFCSTAGFDALHKRLKEGRQVCKDLEEFFKQRAKIEEDYGKALMKLSHSTGGRDETGTLRVAWETLKRQIEVVSQIHISLSASIMEEVSRVNGIVDKHREKRKIVEDGVKKDQSTKKSLYKKTVDLKKVYEGKCKDADLAEKMAKSSNTAPQKEVDKLNAKQQKTRQDADKHDAAYKGSVISLEAARVQWEKNMEQACDIFQTLEEERTQFLRNEVWLHLNMCSQACVDDDDNYELIRVSLENCRQDDDLVEFIENNMTGSDRPVPVLYENYYDPSHSNTETRAGTMSGFSHAFQNVGAKFSTVSHSHRRKGSYGASKDFCEDGLYAQIDSGVQK